MAAVNSRTQSRLDPLNSHTPGHSTGTMYRPHGTIRVFAFKKQPNGKQEWEQVIRTDSDKIAKRVEKVWKDHGFDTKVEG